MSVPQQLGGFNYQIPPRYTIKNVVGAYTVAPADYGTVISCTPTAAFQISLPPAAAVGAGFNVWIWNQPGSTPYALTIKPNGTETLGGLSTWTVYGGEGTQIVSDGANWQNAARKTMKFYAESSAATSLKATASGLNAVAIGQNAQASANYSYSFGQSAVVSLGANQSYSMGYNTIVFNAVNFSYAFGNTGTVPVSGKFAYGSSVFGGDSGHWANYSFGIATTDATATALRTDGNGTSALNQLTLVPNSAFVFTIYVVARQSAAGGTASAAWKIEGLIRQEATAATTTLVTSTVTAISNVPGWTIAVSANTTIGCLTITATGAAATNIRWLATAYTSEIMYA
jgi:hypothetical protein